MIWPGGQETKYTKAAANIQYYPEWVMGGDQRNDGFAAGQVQDPTEWANAIIATPVVLESPKAVEQACHESWSAIYTGTVDIEYGACQYYDGLRQLYTGIQVAGPRLTPRTVDQGYHAIPPKASTSPSVPACFYLPDDYTCVKDQMVQWWDPQGQAPASHQLGCWRMMENGRRYLGGAWPPGDATAQRSPADACNNHAGGVQAFRVE